MTAATPFQPTASREQRAYEPSMEEILASIRRIIADDQSLPGRAPMTPSAAEGAPARQPEMVPHIVHLEPRHEPDLAVEEPVPLQQAHGAVTAPQYASPEGPVPASAVAEMERADVGVMAPEHGIVGDLGAKFETHDHVSSVAEADMPPPEAYRVEPHPHETDHHETPHSAMQPPETHLSDTYEQDTYAHDAYEPEPHHGDASEPEPAAVQPSFQPAEEPVVTHPAYEAPVGRHEPTPFEPAALFSPATDHAVTSAFNTLAATRLADNSDELLALARDMIRPLLKTWLDDNLPSMVERLVRAEIERVARGGR